MRIEEFGKHLAITGFKALEIGDAKVFLGQLRQELPSSVTVQIFNADLVCTSQHLYFAAFNALVAFKNKTNLSNSLALETVLYASTQRQIKKAIDLIGIKAEPGNVAFLIIADTPEAASNAISAAAKKVGKEPDEKVLALSKSKIKKIRSIFGISNVELEASSASDNLHQALVDAVIERVALLATHL